MQGLGRFAGLVAGLVFGILWIKVGLADAVLVLVIGLLGLCIGGVVTGEIDVVALLARINGSPR
jgi:uncharacterized membrane protein